MKKQNLLLLLTFLLVVFIVGASALYNYLDDKVQPDSLVTEEPGANNSEDSENDNEEPKKTPAPDFTVVDIDGMEHSLSDFKGKPVILNFWASWCGPCKSEMPDFEEVYQEYNDTIHFLFVNITDGYQETIESASSYISGQGYTFPVYYDTKLDATSTYGASSIPVTYFIDTEGNIVAWAQGAMQKATILKGIALISEK